MNENKPQSNFLWRNPSFILVWLGQICSQSGGRMYQMAMIWWILSSGTEGTGKLVGLFMVMAALPSILFVKKIGLRIDKSLSQRILVLCDFLAALTVSTVAFCLQQGWLGLPFAFAAGFGAALLQAFIDPTLNKAVGDVVPKEDVESAVALLASTQSLANFTGAVAGALLIERVGIAGTAYLAAGGYLFSSVCTSLARFRYATLPVPKVATEAAAVSGWAILDAYPVLRRVLLGFGCINFFATPILVVLPIYTKKTLMGTANTLGQLEASVWLGLLAGTVLSRFLDFKNNRIKLGAVCVFVFGVALATPGLITDVGVYMAALFIGGTALGVNNVKFVALFQEVVAPELKGRFFALMQAIIGFTFPIAYFLFGLLTDYISPPQVCLIQAGGVIVLALYFLRLSREEAMLGGMSAPESTLVPGGA